MGLLAGSSLSSGCALGGDAIELCRDDEVVLVQSLYLLGVQRDPRVTPAETNVGMVSFDFGERGRALDKSEGFGEVLEPVGSLDPLGFIEKRPVGRLRMISGGLLFAQRRYAAAARRATLLRECYWHLVTSSICRRVTQHAPPIRGASVRDRVR